MPRMPGVGKAELCKQPLQEGGGLLRRAHLPQAVVPWGPTQHLRTGQVCRGMA